MENIFSLLNESWIVSIISVTISGFITIWIYVKTRKSSITRERYDKLIFPIFDVLEPHLFKKIDISVKKALIKAIIIYKQNKPLAGADLNNLIFNCEPITKCTNKNYNDLCSYISKELDKSCRKLGIPVRSLFYRYNRGQFKTKFGYITFIIYYTLQSLILGSLLFLLFLIAATSLKLLIDNLILGK